MNEIKTILDKVVKALTGISGIEAVVLGGSRARGTHSHESDIDIGIYYDKATFDLVSLNKAAKFVDDENRDNLVVPPGEWGKWVNGGGWLVIDAYHVDFILRDAERVESVIVECQEGDVSAHYQIGHPHAYMNVMYMGELQYANCCGINWVIFQHLRILPNNIRKRPRDPLLVTLDLKLSFLQSLQKPMKRKTISIMSPRILYVRFQRSTRCCLQLMKNIV